MDRFLIPAADECRNIVAKEDYAENVSMAQLCTFQAGGPAACFVSPDGEDQLRAVLGVCRKYGVPHQIFGRGSNFLFADSGYRGIVIGMRKHFSGLSADPETGIVTAQAGALLSAAAQSALAASLTGLEFASGIPGTAGGGVRMNAGAYGGEMKQVLIDVTAMDEGGKIHAVSAEDADLSYRHSLFAENGWVILSCRMQLAHGDPEAIRAAMNDLNSRRRAKQPLEYGSAGSTFLRPAGHFAGQLIEQAGLMGYTVGGARVSEKHAGFVINGGNATASDIMAVIRHVQAEVLRTSGVRLETEVCLAGDFDEE
ncbi:MAG: UDP-N-acetylmuramate dehydrogenase [Lachnospiraceae bacterium]|jgi:UDP-N-acetylmuramate dehydrogenase